MDTPSPSRRNVTKKYALLMVFVWTLLVFISLSWNSSVTHENNLEKARIEARTLFELNLSFRRWGALHGGVYVPVSREFQPNPYLQVPERDITTATGRKLTLVNPAWMTRQVFELLAEQSDHPILIHLTSSRFVNPINKPDAWETFALAEFEKGTKELTAIEDLRNEPYMRVMKPFVVEAPCLKCHPDYSVGDIRGGISVSVPLTPHLNVEAHEQRALLMSHVLFWFIGSGGIMLFYRRVERHEKHILVSEEKYRVLFENNPSPMWVYDLETLRFLAANDAAVAHYGFSQAEFLSMTIQDIRPPEDVPRLTDNISRVTAGLDRAGVWRHLKKDGSIIQVEITSHTVDFGGRRAEIVLANDVTERSKLEEQLRQAQKMEAVGLLAGGVAHDFNNVLTAIIGYANLMQLKLAKDDPLRAYAENILSTSQRAAQLTKSLLAFGRKQVISPVPVQLNGIVERIAKLLQRLIREDISLSVSLTSEDTTILADSVQIEQVLMNLATNARDAMPNGGTLAVSTSIIPVSREKVASHGVVPAGRFVMLSVTDTGVGMDERTRERLFEPFFTTKEMGKGTGLGLASAYGVMKQHRGIIDVESEEGLGTTFHLFFPLITEEESGGSAPAEEPVRGGSETILVAEDDGVLRNLTRSVLTEFGYTVIEASDGEEAVQLYRENSERIQLLLFDVIMPKKNGKDAMNEIRAQRPDMRVLFISGYSADIISKEGILAGNFEVITKPVSPIELLQKIRQVLDR
jgi:PAS domain S-box-containing protein